MTYDESELRNFARQTVAAFGPRAAANEDEDQDGEDYEAEPDEDDEEGVDADHELAEAEGADDEEGDRSEADWIDVILANQPLTGRDVATAILEEPDELYYDNGAVVDRGELLAWMAGADAAEWRTWAEEAGFDPDLRPDLDDLPQELALQITADKLDARVAAVREGRAYPL
jgi:GNAT superfamily N-acetyltransferase